MKIAAVVLGIAGSLVQLGILSDGNLFAPASPPSAGIMLALAGLVGAVLGFRMLKLGGIIMLIAGLAGSWLMIAVMNANTTTPETGGYPMPPGLFPVTLLLATFGNLMLIVAGILALISRKAKPKVITG